MVNRNWERRADPSYIRQLSRLRKELSSFLTTEQDKIDDVVAAAYDLKKSFEKRVYLIKLGENIKVMFDRLNDLKEYRQRHLPRNML